MSDTAKQRGAEYLQRVLQLSPVMQASQIVDYRSRLLGIKVTRKTDALDVQQSNQKRERALAHVDLLRQQFWTLPVNVLRQRLDALNVSQFPELKATVDRLKLIALYRNEFNSLGQEPKCNINLLNSLKRVIMLPPRSSGEMKANYLRKLAVAKNLKSIRAMVAMIQKKYPNLYAIESDWFREIARVKGRKNASASADGGGELDIPWWVFGVIAYIIIRIIVAATRFSS